MKIAKLTPSGLQRAARAVKQGPDDAQRSNDLLALLRFAKGVRGAASDRETLEPALLRTIVAFFARPCELDVNPYRYRIPTNEGGNGANLDTIIAVVRAARGRLRLANEGVIDSPDLAALASADESYIRRLAREGVLQRAGSTPRAPLTGASATLFLQRRVRGFTEASA